MIVTPWSHQCPQDAGLQTLANLRLRKCLPKHERARDGRSCVKIATEFPRMWPRAKWGNFVFPLVANPCADDVLREDIATQQEIMISLKGINSLGE